MAKPNFVSDLRHLNKQRARQESTFDTFFAKCGTIFSQHCVEGDRRHNVTHMAKFISIM